MKTLKYAEVTAIPHNGFESYCRAGARWSSTPTQVEVVRLGADEKAAPGQITEAQYAALEADPRIKVRVLVSDERPKPPAPPAATKSEEKP